MREDFPSACDQRCREPQLRQSPRQLLGLTFAVASVYDHLELLEANLLIVEALTSSHGRLTDSGHCRFSVVAQSYSDFAGSAKTRRHIVVTTTEALEGALTRKNHTLEQQRAHCGLVSFSSLKLD